MSVALSMLSLVPGGMGGSETYARELVSELAREPLEISTLVGPAARGFSGSLREVVAEGHPVGGSGRAQRLRGLAAGLGRRRLLTRLLADADVVHYPFTVTVPPAPRAARTVVTLLDVQHHDLPHLFSAAERAYRALAYDRAARHADAVITISEFCKQRIMRHLGIAAERIHVAELGVRQEEFRDSRQPRQEFLLYPARGWPHKNHAQLFVAFGLLRRSRPGLRLLLTGADPRELPPVPDGVDVLGHVSRPELVSLYATAAAVVFPSLYEGFGLPVLEAMASGCPVVVARAGALPEVVADAAVLFDPHDVEGMVAAIERALNSATDLVERGHQRSRTFTWERCGRAHTTLYRHLGG